MNISLESGQNSNYIVTIAFGKEELGMFHEKALATIQKDFEFKGFRKWHVPLDIVKQQTRPEYVSMISFEEGINAALQQVIDENQDKQWIGQPYDIQPSEDWLIITLKLDVYPQATTKNQNYTQLSIGTIVTDITESEIDDAMLNLRKQFATYDNSDVIELTTTNRMRMTFVDQDGQELDKWSLFVNEADFNEHRLFQDLFIGKKVGDLVELMYNHDTLPHVIHYHKDDRIPAKIVFEVINVQTIQIPDLTEETIAQLFGATDVKTEADVRSKVTEIMSESKFDNELTRVTDEYVTAAQSSFEVQVPQTMINEEVKHRVDSLKKQFGGEENFKKFIEAKWQEEMDKMIASITTAATESLTKFFVFRAILDAFGIADVDWEVKMDAEKKLYDKLSSK